ncbi:aminoglycoside phosphotransferase family protein [Streptomyces sp. NPDC088194]|uniref:aminoglycoside phosphotransferase family protein n=1 Tax=Streptomyces sp. NPDC088194 TaxID=3154931 RepID=UPI00344FBF45
MPSDLVDSAVEEFGLVVDQRATGSASGAGVYGARTAEGRQVYLKATPAELGARALAAARRELNFYRQLATALPVVSPRLLGALDDGQGVVLLLEKAGTPRDAASWTPDMWARLGRELAALHGTPPPTDDYWRRPDVLLQALTAPDTAAVTAFWQPALPQLAEVVARRDELLTRSASLPAVLVHGDCHTDNVVFSDGRPVLCDWQESVIGRPVSDLAFLSVRATPTGITVPPALLDAYAEAGSHDRGALEQALLAEELAMFVFLWPGYATYIDRVGTERIHRRGRALADRYFRDTDR